MRWLTLLGKLRPAPTIKIARLPDLPPGGDAVEFVAARRAAGLDDAAIRAELERMADDAEPVELQQPAPALEKYRDFPLELLPPVLARFVKETADALGCDVAFVALPVLCTTAGAIGLSRSVEIKQSWPEYAILWGGLVARSGTMKSPAFDAALKPLRDAQVDALESNKRELEAFEREHEAYLRELAQFRKSKSTDGEPPEKPERPTAVRFVVSDVTVEALATILEANWRGLLAVRDELAGLLRGFDQYKARGRGGEVAAWLEFWRAGSLVVDRKSADKPTLYVPRAAVSLCGTIQPGILRNILAGEHLENGLAARLLLVEPRQLPKRWSIRTPSWATRSEYANLIGALLSLQPGGGERGPEPMALPLSGDALKLWERWFNELNARREQAESDHEAAILSKAEGYGARFGLVVALATDPHATEVSADALRRGTALADWFSTETLRVFAGMSEPDEDRARRLLVSWIGKRGGATTASELSHGHRQFRGRAQDARAALADLVAAGLGRWTYPAPGARGGRPTERFELAGDDPASVTETPPGNGGIVTETPRHGGQEQVSVTVTT